MKSFPPSILRLLRTEKRFFLLFAVLLLPFPAYRFLCRFLPEDREQLPPLPPAVMLPAPARDPLTLRSPRRDPFRDLFPGPRHQKAASSPSRPENKDTPPAEKNPPRLLGIFRCGDRVLALFRDGSTAALTGPGGTVGGRRVRSITERAVIFENGSVTIGGTVQ